MWKKRMTPTGLVLGLLTVSAVLTQAETGSFQVLVDGELHEIGYQAFTNQSVPARFELSAGGTSVVLEAWDTHPTRRIIEEVSVKIPPTPGFPEGGKLDLPLTRNDPGQTGVNFYLGLYSPAAADIETVEFMIKLTTGDKIRIEAFPMTFRRLPDIQNVEILDDTTKPVITWASVPGVSRYKVKVYDLDTGLPLFQTWPFPATSGDMQMLDLKAPPRGGAPIGWTGMELGKRYIIRIEGRLDGPLPMPPPPVVTLPMPKHTRVPAPAPGQGRITRTMRRVEYTPLVPVP